MCADGSTHPIMMNQFYVLRFVEPKLPHFEYLESWSHMDFDLSNRYFEILAALIY